MSLVEFQNVSFAYNKGYASETQALDGVSLCIEEGEFVALVGHNGSGKSTVARKSRDRRNGNDGQKKSVRYS